MKKSLLILILLFIIIFILNATNRKDTAMSYAALNQNIGDIYDKDYTYNITSIKLEEIENKGVMIEFKLSFKVEAGQIDKITFLNYKESCTFDEVYVVSTDIYNLNCKIENLNYAAKYDGGDIEFVLNNGSYNATKRLDDFKMRKANPEALKIYNYEAETEHILLYYDYTESTFSNIEEKEQKQFNRLVGELSEVVETAKDTNIYVFNEETVQEKVYHYDNMEVDIEKLEKEIEIIKKDIEAGITKNKKYHIKLNHKINYGGLTLQKERLIKVSIAYQKATPPLNLRYLADKLVYFLGGKTDPNSTNKYSNLFCKDSDVTENCFSKATSDFIVTLYKAVASISIGLYTLLIVKKIIEKSYATKKLKREDIIKYIMLLVFIKLTIDNSLLIIDFTYEIVIKLVNVVASIDAGRSNELDFTDITKKFFYKPKLKISIRNIMTIFANYTFGQGIIFTLLSLLAIAAFYLAFGYMIVHSCIIIFKRYVYILMYVIIMPLTICFFLDSKLNSIAKQQLKGLMSKLFSGFILTIAIYLMIIISTSFILLGDEFAGTFADIPHIKYPLRWIFGIATPILMLQVIKNTDEFTQKVVGG